MLLSLLVFLLSFSAVVPANPLVRRACAARDFANPVYDQSTVDPYVVGSGGYWYMTRTLADQSAVRVLRSYMLHTWANATDLEVFRPSTSGKYSIVGPELQNIDGKWYIYFAGTNILSSQPSNMRGIFVLKALLSNPQGPYTFLGQVPLPTPWSSDPTLLSLSGSIYLLYSGSNSTSFTTTTQQQLYIVELNNVLNPLDDPTAIAHATDAWEAGVMASPQILSLQGDNVYIVYTGGRRDTANTSLGVLTLRSTASTDPTNPTKWTKSSRPFLSSSSGHRLLGISDGCSVSASGENWIFYGTRTTNSNGKVLVLPNLRALGTGVGTPALKVTPNGACTPWPAADVTASSFGF